MKKNRFIIIGVLCLCFALCIVGCGNKPAPETNEVVTIAPSVIEEETEIETESESETTKKEEQESKTSELETKKQESQNNSNNQKKSTKQHSNNNTSNSNTNNQPATIERETRATAPAEQPTPQPKQSTKNKTKKQKTVSTDPKIEEQTVPAHKHSYVGKITKAATCISQGIKTYTCKKCGDSYTEYIPAIAHAFERKVTKAPTCSEPGVASYVCKYCGKVDHTETIAPTEKHSWKPVMKTKTVYVCTCGQQFDSLSDWQAHSKAQGHGHDSASKQTISTNEVDYYKCSVCGKTK